MFIFTSDVFLSNSTDAHILKINEIIGEIAIYSFSVLCKKNHNDVDAMYG